MKWKAWSLLSPIAVLAFSIGCAGRATLSSGPSAFPATPGRAAHRFASAAEAEAALLELEDRRAFDAGVLTAAARDGDDGTRARAALTLGRLGDDRGAVLLRELLADKSPDVRSAAAFGCQVLGDPALTPDLIPLLSQGDLTVIRSAAKAIGFLARGDGQDALVTAVRSAASPEPKATILAALWKSPNSEIQSLALAYAADPDPRIREAAIYTLARKPLDGSVPSLMAALKDENPDTAAVAARGLGVLGKKESLAALAAALDGGRTLVVINSLVAMETIMEKNPGASLSEETKSRILALGGDANGNVAGPALTLLRQFARVDHGVFRRLWSIATTGEGRRRQFALLSVAAALGKDAVAAIKAAVESPDLSLRAVAGESLAFLPEAEARPWRGRLAADKDPRVRLGVFVGLRTADAVRQNRELVHSSLTDADAGVRAAAVDALGLTNDPAILPLLAEAAEKSSADPGADVAIAVLGVCERLQTDPRARAIAESLYRQRKTLVARLAWRCLIRVFRADPAVFPASEYSTGRVPADYAALLAQAKKPWQATVETSRGTFTIQLAGKAAPLTVMNFVTLAQKKFFDGVVIHRVVPNFVLQDGDPTGTGNGGPGYEIRDEINPLEYARGSVGMALAGPDTGGSQWFVTHSPQPHLNGNYTVFGFVTAGQDRVERIEQGDRITRVTVAAGP